MDPDATLAVMRDESRPLEERLAVAQVMRTWLRRGGFPPDGLTKTQALHETNVLIDKLLKESVWAEL